MKLNVKAFAIAVGVVWGGGVFFFGLLASFFAPAAKMVEFFGPVYVGYDTDFVGLIIGFVWGFVDAGIGALIIAWLYNFLIGKFKAA